MISDNQICVSVIIPEYNAKNFLLSSLPAIKKSDYQNIELIVVHDNSTDGSQEVTEKHADIVIKTKDNGGPGKSRNIGALASNGSILFFVDADVRIALDTISKVVKTMEENQEIDAVFGSYDESPSQKNFFSQYKNLFHHYVHQNANPDAQTFWAGCGAVRKKAFMEAGGFNKEYTSPSIEDVEFGYRLKEKGRKIRLLKELQVTHLKKWNFISLFKTDVVKRAIPWTKLTCEKRLPFDLNFKLADRISGISVCFLVLSLILISIWKASIFLSVILAGILLFTNRKLYRFFIKKRGFKFALFSILFHWFYFLYSSVTFAFLTTIFLTKKFFSRGKMKIQRKKQSIKEMIDTKKMDKAL